MLDGIFYKRLKRQLRNLNMAKLLLALDTAKNTVVVTDILQLTINLPILQLRPKLHIFIRLVHGICQNMPQKRGYPGYFFILTGHSQRFDRLKNIIQKMRIDLMLQHSQLFL